MQGDVIAIVNYEGEEVVRYSYDAWGVCTVTMDNSGCNIANTNPFRYRGYYFDKETGLYYLQSRYYDPELGRFINADEAEFAILQENSIGHNLFGYCGNDSVNFEDLTGALSLDKFFKGIKSAISSFGKFIDRVIGKFLKGYLPFKVKRNRLYINTWIITGVIDGIIALISRVFSAGIKSFISLLKLTLKGIKRKVVTFFRNTLVPFFRKKVIPALKSFILTFLKILGKFFRRNWKIVTNDYVAFSVDKVLPNTGSIANYLFSAISSFGSLVSLFLDISDNEFDGFYSMKIS